MTKKELEQMVIDLISTNRDLVALNAELKNELRKDRDLFIKATRKWNEYVDNMPVQVTEPCWYAYQLSLLSIT